MRKHAGKLIAGFGALILAAGIAVYAQDGPPPGPPDAAGILGFEAGPGGPHHLVKGAPVSAHVSTETVNSLSDGTQIDRKTTGAFYRDSQGRTRHEMTLPAIGPEAQNGGAKHMAFIEDPVAGQHYLLETDEKIARVMPAHHGQGGPSPDAMPERHAGERDGANVTTQSLGTQTINGVSATGTRITRTIPAGEIGNDKPIQVVTEKWYSPELQVNVMTKHTDPRTGTTTTQLTDVNRSEPAETLFQVPADYTVKQGGGRHFGGPPAAGAPAEPPPSDN